ncbi:spectinomycin phosphotransferase [Aquisalibacillus elongatus]|uniref:Spectinomycin phosphotransferase n=2 Tax=Aquisalibacillus elongatus TaxID=485577 RepID=A0A3N5AZJ3_9BACI|nr:spectinomycin phosphotransferase [Aquisalibacillus elongatus]
MNSRYIINQFGFNVEEDQESIYPFSPVYRVGEVIIKRTQSPLVQAHRLVEYLNHLKESGVQVVTPVDLEGSNPVELGEDCYICYPFIEGDVYRGHVDQIRQAGELLGHIHSLSSGDNTYGLEEYDVFDFYHHEVDDHIEKIGQFVDTYQVDIDIDLLNDIFHRSVDQQEELQKAPLTWVETPHDYKANNLIFKEKPFLIDPDNAQRIPRVFDLALALLLFHNEMSTAPHRTFTPQEWQVFLEGYQKYQTFTEQEVLCWEDAVNHVFLDDVMWLLAEEDEDWERQEQRDLFVSIATLISNLDHYTLK